MPKRAFQKFEKLLRAEGKGLLFFPLAVLVIAPLTHELFHILVLEFCGCNYLLSFPVSVSEIFIQIKPLCQLSERQALEVLSAGISGNALLGTLIFFLASAKRISAKTIKGYSRAFYLSATGLGILFSVSISFLTSKGDLTTILNILELEVSGIELALFGLVIMALTVVRFWIDFRTVEEEYTIHHFARNSRRRLKQVLTDSGD